MWKTMKNFRFMGFIFLVSVLATGQARAVNLSQVPLFLAASVEPNIMFLLDDSGSMHWEIMPDEILFGTYFVFPVPNNVYGGSTYNDRIPEFHDPYRQFDGNGRTSTNDVFLRSANNNPIFYDPRISYRPWSDPDGTIGPDANPSAAMWNPGHAPAGTWDLTSEKWHGDWRRASSWSGASGLPRSWSNSNSWRPYWPMTWYMYDGTGNTADPDSYTRYMIRGNTGYEWEIDDGNPNTKEDTVTSFSWTLETGGVITRTVAEEQQNFANWFQYHRSRLLTARAGIGRAFSGLPEDVRIGFGSLNKGSSSVDGASTRSIISGVRRFEGADRQQFFSDLYTRAIPPSGTPLRRALQSAGEYFSRTDSRGPWGNHPGVGSEPSGSHIECRQSYTVIMSDGYWNGGDPSGVGNSDNSSGPVINGPPPVNATYQYTPVDPFRDGYVRTLADVAMDYWKHDLRTDLANRVKTSSRNPAFWQHMVTFTVGLGVSGTVDPDDARTAVSSGDAVSWESPGRNAGKIDDMLHAAINSRGDFFSAKKPDEFAHRLGQMLRLIIATATSSSASIAANSTRLDTGTRVYQAQFGSGDWVGELSAFNLNADGSLGSRIWRASEHVVPHHSRNIFTQGASGGVPFLWGSLTAAQQGALNAGGLGAQRLNYLRGDRTQEQTEGGPFRNRSSWLGDIINSDPAYSGSQNFGYKSLGGAEGISYYAYRADKKARTPTIVVGSNSGMLHGFHADTGEELFAYVPSEALLKMADLTDPNYEHRYLVDGSPTVADVYLGGAWKTVAIGSMGVGGRTVFGLDISNPDTFGGSDVLWEFTHPELGEGVSEVSVVRLADGTWAAIFGNGYNSSSETSQLFMVDISDGSLIQRIDTGVAGGNGMAAPIVVDVDGDRIADLIYAGDINGHLWKFDQAKNGSWQVASMDSGGGKGKGKGSPGPLFIAERDGLRQPITAKPEVSEVDGDIMVYIGTGKFLEEGDKAAATTPIQSVYGIIDSGASVTRADLLEQEVLALGSYAGRPFRVTSENEMDDSLHMGWYVDLTLPGGAPEGERVVNRASVRGDTVLFSTLIPSEDPCDVGGTSWLLALDVRSGSRLLEGAFDLDGDGYIGEDDYVEVVINGDTVRVPISAVESQVGIVSRPVYLSGGGLDHALLSGTSGDIESMRTRGPIDRGRRSWRQLR